MSRFLSYNLKILGHNIRELKLLHCGIINPLLTRFAIL
jgi:hypothetical protein